MMIKVVLYGAGDVFQRLYPTLDLSRIEIVALLDKKFEEPNACTGLPVTQTLAPHEIVNLQFDFVVVCSHLFAFEMFYFLKENGVPKEKVIFAGNQFPYYPYEESEYMRIVSNALTGLPEHSENIKKLNLLRTNIPGRLKTAFYLNGDTVLLNRQRRIKNIFQKSAPKVDYVRVSTLEMIADRILQNRIEGSVAELGVFKGEFARLINEAFSERCLYLFDTFEGFDENECAFDNTEFGTTTECIQALKDAVASYSVEACLSSMPFPERIILKKGYFPDTAQDISEDTRFAFVNIDTDLYTPILAGLKFFYPRLSYGGYIMVHDYNDETLPGVHAAVDEFCGENGLVPVPVCDIGGSAIITAHR